MADLNTLDVRRLLCPMPVIKTQDRVKLLSCRINGHKVISCEQSDVEIKIVVEVG
jgi:TusA-related sulfurtransferase